jgi:hypothetical protein
MAFGAPAVAARLSDPHPLGAQASIAVLAAAVLLTGLFADGGAAYMLGVAVIVRMLYDGARLLSAANPVIQQAILLGRYSLMAYVAQIALIQLLFRFTGAQRWSVGWEVLALVLVTAALMLALCMAVEKWRASSPLFDKSYRLVFT